MITEGNIILEDSSLYNGPTEYKLGSPFTKGESIISKEEYIFYTGLIKDNELLIHEVVYNDKNNSFKAVLKDKGKNWVHRVEVD